MVQGVQTILPVGRIIHKRYRVEALLGRGGFGAVYRVRDERVKGNLFALKEVVDPGVEERESFMFECSILKRLDHPALPRVYQEFEDQGTQRVYMLMDFVDGPNLEYLRRQQPEGIFPLERVLQLMAPIFEAVSYLHKQDPPIIHRDIKPANIIVPKESNASVLVDLGIAKEYDQEGTTTTTIRRCSPGYGAPEQYARGTNQRTDIYGLAATLYVLLTGTVPTDAFYRMTQLGGRNLDPLEFPRVLIPDLPQGIADAIMRALSIDSNDRFATAEEFWQALESASGDRAIFPVIPPTTDVVEPALVEVPASSEPSDTGVTTVVYSIASAPKRISPLQTKNRSFSISWPLFFILLMLIALGTGVIFGTRFFAFAISPNAPASQSTRAIATSAPVVVATHVPIPTPTALPTPVPTAIPTSVPTAIPTPVPTAIPTPVPTPVPTAIVAPPPVQYPQLSVSYAGKIVNQYVSPVVTSSMSLSNIQQRKNDPLISGYFSVGPELLGNGNFSGSVTQQKQIQFVVASYNGLLPLFFIGSILPDGSMQGTYCSARQNGTIYQCDKVAGGYGTWQLNPRF